MGGGYSAPTLNSVKEKGDIASKAGDYPTACFYYTLAIVTKENQEAKELAILFSNRSHALFKCNLPENSLDDALQAISLAPLWAKPYYRAAKAARCLRKFDEAKEFLGKSLALAPNDTRILEESNSLRSESSTTSRVYSGSLFIWGRLGDYSTDRPRLIDELKGRHIKEVACGASHTCCLLSNGEVYAFGDNKHSQLGVGPLASSVTNQPNVTVKKVVLVTKLLGTHIVAINAGAGHTIAIADDGTVYGWGMANLGQLGMGECREKVVTEPMEIVAMKGKAVNSVACGVAHTLFLLRDGSVEACGMNTYGQLGLNEIAQQTVLIPRRVDFPDGSRAISHIACGGAHSIVIDTAGRIYSCGSNCSGQLGIDSCEDQSTFIQIKTLELSHSDSVPEIAFAACGEEFSVVVSRDRRVYSFGLSICGQLGLGLPLVDKRAPTRIAVLDNCAIESVSCSQGHVFALNSSGHVWTWGLSGDKFGQAQDESAIVHTPQILKLLSNNRRIIQIASGRKHYCLVADGAYGPFCRIKNGSFMGERKQDIAVGDTHEDTASIKSNNFSSFKAGVKLLFTIETYDSHGERCTSFGARIEVNVTCLDAVSPLISQQRHQQQSKVTEQILAYAKDASSESNNQVFVDDNMDGTYSGDFTLNVSGQYRLTIFVDGMEIQDSPINFQLTSDDQPFPAYSFAWWGKFAVPDSFIVARQDDPKSGCPAFATRLHCNKGDTLVFTVSCFDRYHNKVTDISDYATVYFVYRASGYVMQKFPEHIISTGSFDKSSCGLFPCFFQSPEEPGDYFVEVQIEKHSRYADYDGSTTERVLLGHIRGSPFPLLVSESLYTEVQGDIAGGDNNADVRDEYKIGTEAATRMTALPAMLEETAEQVGAISMTEREYEDFARLRRQEMTRRKAQDALLQTRAANAQERARKLREKAVKRVGGGFSIQYSKDI